MYDALRQDERTRLDVGGTGSGELACSREVLCPSMDACKVIMIMDNNN